MPKDDLSRLVEDDTGMSRQEAGAADVCDLVRIFAERSGMTGEDPIIVLGDLLTDLRHYADSKGLDWDAVELQSGLHYSHESDDFDALVRAPFGEEQSIVDQAESGDDDEPDVFDFDPNDF